METQYRRHPDQAGTNIGPFIPISCIEPGGQWGNFLGENPRTGTARVRASAGGDGAVAGCSCALHYAIAAQRRMQNMEHKEQLGQWQTHRHHASRIQRGFRRPSRWTDYRLGWGADGVYGLLPVPTAARRLS